LIFHEVKASLDLTFKHDSGKVGRISVIGGSMSAQEIVKDLEWIVVGDHQWDLRPTNDSAFKVVFPTKANVSRLWKIGNIPIEDTKMFLHFEEWSSSELDKFELTEVWVQVHDVFYKERCDYLVLFVEEVDMDFTRNHSVVRMLVVVTRVEHLPKGTVDHIYDGKGYGLIFKLEDAFGDVNPNDNMSKHNLYDALGERKKDPSDREGNRSFRQKQRK
jgi:hypothetical protein